MKMKCQGSNPWGLHMMQFLYDLNDNFIPDVNGAVVDIVSNLLISTKSIRYGAKPSVEGQYRIRQIVRLYIGAGKSIPVLVPWGSIKADFSSKLDIAEVTALSSLSNLNERVKKYYGPGLDINIRIEDLSGEELFKFENGYNKSLSDKYSSDLETLINMMDGLTARRESKMADKEAMFATYAQANTKSILAYLIESKDLIKTDSTKCTTLQSYRNLKANGWKGIISHEQREHYLGCYRELYHDEDENSLLRRLALYFGGSLTRFQLGMTGANPEWGSDYLQISFTPPIKGLPEGYNDNYLYYRTVPMNQCRTHHAPWRVKGYFLISEDDEMKAKICTFSTVPENLEESSIIIESDDTHVEISASYLI